MADFNGQRNIALTIIFGVPNGATPTCTIQLDGVELGASTHNPVQVGSSNLWTLLLTTEERNGIITTVIVETTGVITYQYFTIESNTPQTGDAFYIVDNWQTPTVIVTHLPIVVPGAPIKITRGATYAIIGAGLIEVAQVAFTPFSGSTGYVCVFGSLADPALTKTATLVGSSSPYSFTIPLTMAETQALPATATTYWIVEQQVETIADVPTVVAQAILVEGAVTYR